MPTGNKIKCQVICEFVKFCPLEVNKRIRRCKYTSDCFVTNIEPICYSSTISEFSNKSLTLYHVLC